MVWPVKADPRHSDEVWPDDTFAQTRLEHLVRLDLNKPEACTRLTGIMASIGQSSRDPVILEKMMAAGMNMARLNASFDTPEVRLEVVKMLRNAARLHGLKMGYTYPLAIALDLCGPVIRTGIIGAMDGKIQLDAGDEVTLTTDEAYLVKGSHKAVYVNYPRFSLKVNKGQVVYIDNELLKLRVETVSGAAVTCRVERGGTLRSQKDVKIPGVQIDLPTFSERDQEDINFAVQNQLDMIITSYVDKAKAIELLRNLLGDKGKKIAIVCKIQNFNALNNLDELMRASDSIIIARQELGTDINSRKLIKAQKYITTRAMAMGKPCGVLAQVFHSMHYERIPLRAEIMDAGNCVLDGADYMLLSAETASGPRPVEAVAVLADVLKEAESCVWVRRLLMDLIDQVPSPCTPVEGVTLSAALAAQKYGAAAIIVTTTSGRSAALMARFRPRCPVLAVTRYSPTSRLLHMYRGIIPIVFEDQPNSNWQTDVDKRMEFCFKFGYDNGFLKPGDPIVLITGWKQGQGFTNTMRLITATPISLKSHIYTPYDVGQFDEAKARSPFEHLFSLDVKKPTGGCRLTGIMSTIGPASRDQTVLEHMMAAGMNMARLNASFDTVEQRAECVSVLRRAAASYGRKLGRIYPLAVAIDLCGPVLRTGNIDALLGGKIELEVGDEIKLTTDDTYRDKGSHNAVFVNYERFADKVKKGNVIYINNELLKLRVELVSGSTMTCRVQRGGPLTSQRDVKVPGVILGIPTFSDRDIIDIDFAIEQQLDIIIASYIETAEHVKELRQLLGEKGRKIAVVCKIQNKIAYNNLNDIMEESDSIIVARQELGTDIEPKKLIIAQKSITAKAMSKGKPCGVLAQVLHSMHNYAIPLRAELLDAGNCVMDGADYLLLSAETAVGKHPVESVATLAGIVKEAESCVWFRQLFSELVDQVQGPCSPVEGTALAAALAARKLCAGAIVVATTSGRSARLVSRFRPRCPVLAVTRYPSVARQLHLCRGIIPLVYEDATESNWEKDVDKRVDYCIQFGFGYGFLKPGDPIVTVTGWKHASGFTNTMRLIYARDVREESKTY